MTTEQINQCYAKIEGSQWRVVPHDINQEEHCFFIELNGRRKPQPFYSRQDAFSHLFMLAPELCPEFLKPMVVNVDCGLGAG